MARRRHRFAELRALGSEPSSPRDEPMDGTVRDFRTEGRSEEERHERTIRSLSQRTGHVLGLVLAWGVVLAIAGWGLSHASRGMDRDRSQTSAAPQIAAYVPPTDAVEHGTTNAGDLQHGIGEDQLYERAVRYCENSAYPGPATDCVAAVENGDADIGFWPPPDDGSKEPTHPGPYGP